MIAEIAFIDDDPIFARMLKRKLDKKGVDLQHYIDPESFHASQKAEGHNFSAALVDLHMPDSNGVVWAYAGLESVRQIKDCLGGGRKVFILSGMNGHGLDASSKTNGADGFIHKDDGLDSITSQILEHICEGQAHTES